MQRAKRRLQDLSNLEIFLFLMVLAIGTSLLSGQWSSDWLLNLSTEMVGAIVTFLLFELIFSTRQKKEQLIREMRSRVNGTAVNAVEALRDAGWLTDGSLENISLIKADLTDADLTQASLKGAIARHTHLTRAILKKTDLTGADLSHAMVQDAELEDTILSTANLARASFSGSKLKGIIILPDGTTANSIAELGRFTNPDREDFWRPPDKTS